LAVLTIISIVIVFVFWIVISIVIVVVLFLPLFLVRTIFGHNAYLLLVNKIKNFLLSKGFKQNEQHGR
jgi:hypothetical protein